MGIFAIIMMIIGLVADIPKIIELIKAIIALFKGLSPEHKAIFTHRMRDAADALKATGDKVKYAEDLQNILGDMQKVC